MGTIARIPTQCYPKENIIQSLLQEAVEWRSIGYKWRTFRDALMKRREKLGGGEEKLRKDMDCTCRLLRTMERSIQRSEEWGGEIVIGLKMEVKKGVRWVEKWRKRKKAEERKK